MSMIWEGATSQVQVVVSYIPVYSFGKVFIVYYKHLSNDLYVFWSSIHRNIFENDGGHKVVDTLISSSIKILEKYFSFNRQKYIHKCGESKTLIEFTIYWTISDKNWLALGLSTLQGARRQCAERYLAL